MTQIFRVVVRGQFDGLDDGTKAKLIDEATEHHFLRSAFTSEGTFTYDEQLVSFNLRYEMRSNQDVPDEAESAIAEEALERAGHWLREAGLSHKRLRASVTNMASMWH